MVVQFLKDYKVWSDFASADSEKFSRFNLAERSYTSLVGKYCGPDKQHQLITFSSDASFNPDTDTVVSVDESEEKTVVRLSHGARGWDECFYEFDFHLRSNRWVLDEVYYLDEFDNNARLKFL